MPCLNEAETLATCIQKAKRFLAGAGIDMSMAGMEMDPMPWSVDHALIIFCGG